MNVIQDNEPFEQINCLRHRDKPAFGIWFYGRTFERLLDHIKDFPKSYRLHQIEITHQAVHFHCERKHRG